MIPVSGMLKYLFVFGIMSAAGMVCLQAQPAENEPVTEGISTTLKARVERDKGRVEYLKTDETAWKDLKKRIVLKEGDTVRTYPNAGALATLLSQSVIIIDASTRLTVKEMYQQQDSRKVNVLLDLAGGTILCDVKNLPTDDSRYIVHTPTATAAVRGTRFMVSYLAGVSKVTVLKGAVDVLDSAGRELRLSDRMEIDAGLGGAGEPASAEPATLSGMTEAFRNGGTGAPDIQTVSDQSQFVLSVVEDDLPLDISETPAPSADDDDF